jgi:hypothetical protein
MEPPSRSAADHVLTTAAHNDDQPPAPTRLRGASGLSVGAVGREVSADDAVWAGWLAENCGRWTDGRTMWWLWGVAAEPSNSHPSRHPVAAFISGSLV